MPAPFRIVHLTDLHLTADDRAARSEPRLFGRLRGMNQTFRELLASTLLRRADCVLITGDVTDSGQPAEWDVFWEAVDAARLPGRLLVLPGNHDVCCLGLRAPRRDELQRDLQRAREGLRRGRQPIDFPWVRRVDERVTIFGLESSNPGNLSALDNAVGELGFIQLEALARALRKHREAPVKIIALHHSPNIPGRETAEERGLPVTGAISRWAHEVPEADRRALRLLAVTHGVRLIVHGHLHRAEDRRVNGVRIIGAPASTQPIDKGAAEVAVYGYTVNASGSRVTVRQHRVEARP